MHVTHDTVEWTMHFHKRGDGTPLHAISVARSYTGYPVSCSQWLIDGLSESPLLSLTEVYQLHDYKAAWTSIMSSFWWGNHVQVLRV